MDFFGTVKAFVDEGNKLISDYTPIQIPTSDGGWIWMTRAGIRSNAANPQPVITNPQIAMTSSIPQITVAPSPQAHEDARTSNLIGIAALGLSALGLIYLVRGK